ncbi:hypothetical protein PoB_003389800 [Plakobranchus ocellatus]|uniref:Uncharacterized protein n=1 Tax=Plakobranchus ocellatus TaxID=259542 RepID=A0AAV4ALF4_9GAST|nr:hypothetical protein PoB_003389800 [Plakobranchus ocellatus]
MALLLLRHQCRSLIVSPDWPIDARTPDSFTRSEGEVPQNARDAMIVTLCTTNKRRQIRFQQLSRNISPEYRWKQEPCKSNSDEAQSTGRACVLRIAMSHLGERSMHQISTFLQGRIKNFRVHGATFYEADEFVQFEKENVASPGTKIVNTQHPSYIIFAGERFRNPRTPLRIIDSTRLRRA